MKRLTGYFILAGLYMASAEAAHLSLAVDAASFQYDATAAFVEVYYQIQDAWPAESLSAWAVQADMDIYRNDSLYTQTSWVDTSELKTGQTEISLTGRVYFLAIRGEYEIHLTVQNKNTGESDLQVLKISAEPYVPEHLLMSDIELASQIDYVSKENKGHPFYKNGLMISPIPSRVFGKQYLILYYYFEIYSIPDSLPGTGISIQTQILDSQNQPVSDIPARPVQKAINNPAIVEVGQLGLFPLSTGEYLLQVSLSTDDGSIHIMKEKPFYIFKDSPRIEVAISSDDLYHLSPFIEMDSEQAEEQLDYIRYLASNSEKKIMKDIGNLDGKRRFLFNFWNGRDKNPMTPNNEKYEEYLSRIREADRRFTTMQREGWKTDRGRVFLIYGPPDDINHFPVTSERVPFEIWVYQLIEGGVEFIFADLSGYNEYQLIHSSKQGEVYNPQYEDLILK